MQLHRPQTLERLEELDARILVISFAEPRRFEHWISFFYRKFLAPVLDPSETLSPVLAQDLLSAPQSPFARTRFLSDSTRVAYRAYGLGRLSPWKAGRPHILGQYLQWALERRPIRLTTQDVLQRGADFVVARDGRVAFRYIGDDQSDLPPADALLSSLIR